MDVVVFSILDAINKEYYFSNMYMHSLVSSVDRSPILAMYWLALEHLTLLSVVFIYLCIRNNVNQQTYSNLCQVMTWPDRGSKLRPTLPIPDKIVDNLEFWIAFRVNRPVALIYLCLKQYNILNARLQP